MRMHDEIGRLRPFCAPADEPDELLTGAESVDDGCCRIAGEKTTRSEFGNLFGGSSISDGGRIMPKALSADSSVAAIIVSCALRSIGRHTSLVLQ